MSKYPIVRIKFYIHWFQRVWCIFEAVDIFISKHLCTEPESFVRGDPTLITVFWGVFCFVFLLFFFFFFAFFFFFFFNLMWG